MDLSKEILSDLIVYTKYAKYLPNEQRRESWHEVVTRNKNMHIKRFPQLAEEIERVYTDFVLPKKILPSMRAMQFAGRPVEINPVRSYNCFGKNERFVTSVGVKSFSDFTDGDEVIVLTHTGSWKKAVVRNYGRDQLYKITIKRGNSKDRHVLATKTHRWILKDGTETTNLSVGNKLMECPAIFNDFDYYDSTPEERLWWAYGYVFGDGTTFKDKTGNYKSSGVRLCGKEKTKYLDRFLELGFTVSTPPSFDGDVMVYTGSYLKTKPPVNLSTSSIRAFVAGYLDADGAKINDATMVSKFSGIVSTGEAHQWVVENLFPVAGVFVSSKQDISNQITNFGPRSNSMRYGISTNLTCKTNMSFVVTDITPHSIDDVWCLEVEDDRSFVLANGIVTGNCSYLPMEDPSAFSELMFLLLSGTGVGYSVQQQHIKKLPVVTRTKRTKRYLIADSIEGWADAVKQLINYYYRGKSYPIFDFSDIRPKGARLITSGGKAPGPQPLKDCLHNIQKVFDTVETGEQLSSLNVHDICCYIADAVLSGGIRRSAMISLFNIDDDDMLTCKFGTWYDDNPQRARANNSAVIVRHKITKEVFDTLWDKIKNSGSGEPGFFMTNSTDWGLNPCKPLKSLILTDQGYITFEQALQLPSLRVMTPSGEWKSATAPFKTGEQRNVTKVVLSNGMPLYGTENHQHQLTSGEWKRIDELKIGDRLSFAAHAIHETKISNVQDYEQGILEGWLIADGWNYPRTSEGTRAGNRAGIVLGYNEFDLVPLFERLTGNIAKPHAQKPNTAKTIYVDQSSISSDFSKKSYDWLRLRSVDYKLGLLRAVFTADGSVRQHNNCELYSIQKSLLEVIQTILLEFGIRSTISIHNYAKSYIASDNKIRNNSDCWKLNVYAGQFKHIGFLSSYKSIRLDEHTERNIYRRQDYETVVDIIENDSVEDVYDITVHDDSHAFYDTGVVTHNCAEISLRPYQFCNLSEINVNDVDTQDELNARAKAAAFVGTLQASYTDFHYLRDEWKTTTEKEALIGVSMTGIASGKVLKLDLEQSAEVVKMENARVAKLIGINKAARCTTVKPSGTASLVLGTSSGIHAWHNKYYIRRIRIGKNEAIYNHLQLHHPELLEDEYFKPLQQSVVSIPVKAPSGAITRKETALDLLHRVSLVWNSWVKSGHRKGDNVNNVSATIAIRTNEWDEVGEWMWDNRNQYTALSVFPYDDHTYQQAPFEDCTKEQFEAMYEKIKLLDLSAVYEPEDETELQDNLACFGGSCEIV